MNPSLHSRPSTLPSRALLRLLPALTGILMIGSLHAAGTPLTNEAQNGLNALDVVLHSHDGGGRHFLLDTGHVVQFPARGSGRAAELRSASQREQRQLKGLPTAQEGIGLKAVDGETVSPVLRDASGKPWALPGGLIVTFEDAVSEAEAMARLHAAGLTPERALNPLVWLAKSPAGLATIELANRLNAQALFADVSPNWWTPRHLK
ncbi:MAG: hypothetical protein Q4D91_03535 [Lautropia sp.]|nr:hypothetical protein [Lautropia sp.]